ncbi:hypothetical protein PoB_005793000 [Plakobranchus ocellatus]|uniref:Uncharacterized protein n=1 Tax=Plakobranchus ocellatus TaxID=259542 RepID=A0AAV4CIK2_9GAST|nr:hypothetical protein PoB_005793000 [Plakobranchus ocellatus]
MNDPEIDRLCPKHALCLFHGKVRLLQPLDESSDPSEFLRGSPGLERGPIGRLQSPPRIFLISFSQRGSGLFLSLSFQKVCSGIHSDTVFGMPS